MFWFLSHSKTSVSDIVNISSIFWKDIKKEWKAGARLCGLESLKRLETKTHKKAQRWQRQTLEHWQKVSPNGIFRWEGNMKTGSILAESRRTTYSRKTVLDKISLIFCPRWKSNTWVAIMPYLSTGEKKRSSSDHCAACTCIWHCGGTKTAELAL